MVETEQSGENQAAAEPETENQNTQVEDSSQEQSYPSAGEQDKNWKEIRSTVKELKEQNRQLQEEITQMRSPPPQQQEEEEEQLSDDDIPTVKYMKRNLDKTYKKAKEDAYKDFYNKTAEERLELKFNDFRSVCSKENINKLNERYPDLARSLASNKDAYSQGKAAYDLILKLRLNDQEVEQNREKLNKNSQKPQMGASAKAGALDSAHLFESGARPALTKSLKEQLWEETRNAAKGF